MLNEVVGPFVATGNTVAVRATGPANAWRLDNVIVEVSDEPGCIVREVGFAAMLKSGIVP
jgi:hypothetical protein